MLLEEGISYDQCVLLPKLCWPLPCFILSSKAKLACYSRYLLTSYFCILILYDEKDISPPPLVLVLEGLVEPFFIEPFNFSFFSISDWGIDLDFCDVK